MATNSYSVHSRQTYAVNPSRDLPTLEDRWSARPPNAEPNLDSFGSGLSGNTFGFGVGNQPRPKNRT